MIIHLYFSFSIIHLSILLYKGIFKFFVVNFNFYGIMGAKKWIYKKYMQKKGCVSMKTAAIICEYNPFHNGHKYQIQRTRALTGCDAVIAIMSGNYVQRGDVSVFDKRLRAEAALACGIDLVIELPVLCAMTTAEKFAHNGVLAADALGADYLAFGAETDDLPLLQEIAGKLAFESDAFRLKLKEYISPGAVTYAAARAQAIADILGPKAQEALSFSNNILAVEYLKALIRLNSGVKPLLIRRIGTEHNSMITYEKYASASALRTMMKNGEDCLPFIPPNASSIFHGRQPNDIKTMEKAIIASICAAPLKKLHSVSDVAEGIENRLQRIAFSAGNMWELIEFTKSKRYTQSRIRRIILSAYLGITKEDFGQEPLYLKILGFTPKGQELLGEIKRTAKLPLAKNMNAVMQNQAAARMWKRELIFDRIYHLFYGE